MASSTKVETVETRGRDVSLTDDELSVALTDGRTITVPLAWYPRLANATPEQRAHWETAGAGQGIHWPEIDEDLRTAGVPRRRVDRRRGGRRSLSRTCRMAKLAETSHVMDDSATAAAVSVPHWNVMVTYHFCFAGELS